MDAVVIDAIIANVVIVTVIVDVVVDTVVAEVCQQPELQISFPSCSKQIVLVTFQLQDLQLQFLPIRWLFCVIAHFHDRSFAWHCDKSFEEPDVDRRAIVLVTT